MGSDAGFWYWGLIEFWMSIELLELLGVESHLHHLMEWCQTQSKRLSCVESRQQQWNEVVICYETEHLSMKMTKHNQATATSSESLELLPQRGTQYWSGFKTISKEHGGDM
jgi:hypothetical protein